MKNKLDIKPPREDWIIGAIAYDLEQMQLEERRQMYGPAYLDRRIEELSEDLEKSEYPEDQELEARALLEKYRQARRNYDNALMQSDDDDESFSQWAVEQARIHCITYVARQLIIEKMQTMNATIGKYWGNDIAHRVRKEVWEYLQSDPALENDIGELISHAVETYGVLDMTEETIDAAISEARHIFHQLMLTSQD